MHKIYNNIYTNFTVAGLPGFSGCGASEGIFVQIDKSLAAAFGSPADVKGALQLMPQSKEL